MNTRMKVLVNCDFPFGLTHGGQQVQIERTMAFLQAAGVEVEPVRWWDDQQSGQIIHYFGRMPSVQLELAQKKGMKVVMAELLTGQGSRSPRKLLVQRMVRILIQRFAPPEFSIGFEWDSYRNADALVALTSWEGHLMNYIFGGPRERIVIVPHGIEDVFLDSEPIERSEWLVCAATITERKRVLELAEAAVQARTPLRIVGRPYSESDPYAQRFNMVVKQNPQWLRVAPHPFSDRKGLAAIYRGARAFVLLSSMESRSLAAEEAAACECPLLLSDLPWARSVFGEHARYCPITSATRTAPVLRQFYDAAPGIAPPPKPLRENQVAQQLKGLYEKLLQGQS